MNKEIWKVIPNSNGHYYISNLGRMKRDDYEFIDARGRNHKTKAKVWDTGTKNNVNGYSYYDYRTNDGKRKSRSIHRLVAEAFIENPQPDTFDQVNHIDANKSNNCVDNLEWCNEKLNMEHASRNGLINKDSEKRKKQAPINARLGAEKTRLPCAKYDRNGNLVGIIEGLSSENCNTCIQRLTYKKLTYRYCYVLIEKYGEVPQHINAERSFKASTNTRKKYIEYTKDGKVNEYITLKDLPISRELMWLAFNHEIPDRVIGSTWDIVELDKSLIPKREQKGVTVHALDDDGNICMIFKSVQDMKKAIGISGLNWFYQCVKEHRKYKGYYWETIHD